MKTMSVTVVASEEERWSTDLLFIPRTLEVKKKTSAIQFEDEQNFKLCPGADPRRDGDINEVLELLSVDAACALLTPARETVLCAARRVNIETSLNIWSWQERREANLFLFVCSAPSLLLLLSFFLLSHFVSPLLLSLYFSIAAFPLIAFPSSLTSVTLDSHFHPLYPDLFLFLLSFSLSLYDLRVVSFNSVLMDTQPHFLCAPLAISFSFSFMLFIFIAQVECHCKSWSKTFYPRTSWVGWTEPRHNRVSEPPVAPKNRETVTLVYRVWYTN